MIEIKVYILVFSVWTLNCQKRSCKWNGRLHGKFSDKTTSDYWQAENWNFELVRNKHTCGGVSEEQLTELEELRMINRYTTLTFPDGQLC